MDIKYENNRVIAEKKNRLFPGRFS